MKPRRAFLRQAGCLAVAALAAGCRPASSVPSAKPRTLKLGYTPAEESVADREQAARTLAQYLERELGQAVELVRTASYGPAVDALARGEIDVIGLGPFAYVLAAARGAAEVLVVTGDAVGAPRQYQSLLVTHRRTGVRSLGELPADAGRLRLDFTDPASNSGHLVPLARLRAEGLEPARDFRGVEFTLSHSVSVFNVLFDRTDVAGVSASVVGRLRAKGRLPDDELVVLWASDRLPSGPIAVHPGLEASVKANLRRALLALPERDPAAARAVMAQYQEANLRFVAAEDTLYDGLRQLATQLEPERIIPGR